MATTLRQKLEAAGCKEVPNDHWIYSEGPVSIVGSAPPIGPVLPEKAVTNRPVANTTAAKLTAGLKRMIGRAVDEDGVSDAVDLEEDESLSWVASTWIEPALVNIYCCSASNEPDSFIATLSGDGGVLETVSGPWSNLDVAKESFGNAPEGWS